MIVTYDIETLKNFFCYIDIDYKTQHTKIFKIGFKYNDIVEFLTYLLQKPTQVGFNNLSFDSQVCQYIIENSSYWNKHVYTPSEIANEIYKYSQTVINKQDTGEWSDYPEWKLTCPQIDLFRIHHFNNEAKRTSLKWVQYMINWHNLEDMPIDHTTEIKEEDIEMIIEYCKNDVLSTQELLYLTLGKTNLLSVKLSEEELSLYKDKDKIQLRRDIQDEFGIKCINYDDVKIGDALNMKGYLDLTGLTKKELREKRTTDSTFTFKECIPSYIEFKTLEMDTLLNKIKDIVVDLNKKQEFTFTFKNTTYTIAKGGLHSVDQPRIIKPIDNEELIDSDIGSQYPNSLRKRNLYPRHLGKEWLTMYSNNIEKRIYAKHQYKSTKLTKYASFNECFKLSLNGGGYGKLNEKNSWQRDPFIMMNVTIGNQMEILMLIEEMELNNISVISANTDGILCLFDKSLEPTHKKICEEWEKKVGNFELGKLEHTEYELLVQNSVNSYIALKKGNEPINKRAKYKSEFTIAFELHKNKSGRIINLALSEYFLKGVSPEVFIKNHKNIYDFCMGVRAKKGWYFQTEEITNSEYKEERQQKTIRYYVSNNGKKIIKVNNDGRRIQTESGKWLQTIFNKYISKPWDDYDINYDYYISRTFNIINNIDNKVTRKFTQLELNF